MLRPAAAAGLARAGAVGVCGRHAPNPLQPYLLQPPQELLAIQQDDGPKNLGFFGTRNMGMTHQKLVEILSYAMVSTVGAAAECWRMRSIGLLGVRRHRV